MDIEHLVKFQDWCNSRLQENLKEVPAKDLDHEFRGIRTLRELVVHYVNSYDYMWLPGDQLEARLENLSKMDINQLLQELEASFTKFVEAVNKLEGEQSFNAGERKVTINLENYVLLYTDHLSYHRGQIVSVLKQLGKPAPNLDYYTFAATISE